MANRSWFVTLSVVLIAAMLGSVLTLVLANNTSFALWAYEMGGSSGSPAQSSLLDDSQAQSDQQSSSLSDFSESFQTQSLNSLADLKLAIEDAEQERMQLAGVLASLTQKLETIESDFINQQSRLALADDASGEAGSEANPDTGDRRSRNRIESLLAAGLDIATAQQLQARQNEYQLRRLDLFDLAEREGWRDSEQFREQLSALNDERPDLREELGEAGYDRYLYEAGRNNRVRIESIIDGSAADLAGLQVGDLVINYANSRVFSTRELQNATRGGLRGESVIMTIERQGQSVFIDVPRGPLGVGLDAESQNPS